MTLVFKQDIAGPATHAILIGVGAYTHLVGGEGDPHELFPGHGGMGQLSSPPYSARAMADWLLTGYSNPDKPLASLDLLLSDPDSKKYAPPGGDEVEIQRATMDLAKPAVKAWKKRGDDSTEHFMIFFFCGHGVAQGYEMTLLLEDFGADHDAPFENAIDFGSFHLGMEKCQARQQCFFIDACRAFSTELLASYDPGDAIVPGSALLTNPQHRSAPAYHSTVPGSPAFGREGRPSIFTEALLQALKGAGADDYEGDWRIYPGSLYDGITHLMERVTRGNPDLGSQVCVLQHHPPRFSMHHLDGLPLVPVDITCKPFEANANAELAYERDEVQIQRDAPEASEWFVDIPPGDYRFSAEFSAGSGYVDSEVSQPIRPVYRPIIIEVQT